MYKKIIAFTLINFIVNVTASNQLLYTQKHIATSFVIDDLNHNTQLKMQLHTMSESLSGQHKKIAKNAIHIATEREIYLHQMLRKINKARNFSEMDELHSYYSCSNFRQQLSNYLQPSSNHLQDLRLLEMTVGILKKNLRPI